MPTTYREQPQNVKYLLWHNNVMYGAGDPDNPAIIYYSTPNMPFYWSSTYYQ